MQFHFFFFFGGGEDISPPKCPYTKSKGNLIESVFKGPQ